MRTARLAAVEIFTLPTTGSAQASPPAPSKPKRGELAEAARERAKTTREAVEYSRTRHRDKRLPLGLLDVEALVGGADAGVTDAGHM